MQREEILQAISQKSEVSVLIIGAGINGVATFRDLALQGINVLLVDRGDFCSGASAASSHMAHGGIRYLENGEFRLVREAVEERNRLIKNAPHYVSPLPTVIPIFKWFSGMLNAPLKFLGLLDKPSERGAAIIKVGLLLYDAYTGAERTVPRHEFLTRTAALARYPQLNPDIVRVAEYYDGLIRCPERLCMELITDSQKASAQALALNYTSVIGAGGGQVLLRDETSGEQLAIRPQVVVNASGPWIDLTNQTMTRPTNLIGGTKGSHLVLEHPELRQAIGEHEFFFENKDGRIVLICPLHERVLVGTSDIRITNPDQAHCTDEEIDYFLGMTARVFPGIQVRREQIVFTFSGVRPLPAANAKSTGQISRDHNIETVEAGNGLDFPILNLVGGKWTTFRAFAEQTTDQVLQRLARPRQTSTISTPIGGGRGYPQDEQTRMAWLAEQRAISGLTAQQMTMLFKRYGTLAATINAEIAANQTRRAAVPLQHAPDYLRGEVVYLACNEQVVHLDDFVLRRSSLAMLGQLTRPLLSELCAIIGEVCGWSVQLQQEELERTLLILQTKYRVQVEQRQGLVSVGQ